VNIVEAIQAEVSVLLVVGGKIRIAAAEDESPHDIDQFELFGRIHIGADFNRSGGEIIEHVIA
jgi:hypothetical protein